MPTRRRMCASPLAHRPDRRWRTWPSSASARIRSRRLQSLLKLVGGRVPLLLEIKVEGDIWRWAPALDARLAGYGGPFGVMSFDPRLRAAAQDANARIPRGLVVRNRSRPGFGAAWRSGSPLPNFSRWTERRSASLGSRAPGSASRSTAGRSAPGRTRASVGSCRRPHLGRRWPTAKLKSSRASRRAFPA